MLLTTGTRNPDDASASSVTAIRKVSPRTVLAATIMARFVACIIFARLSPTPICRTIDAGMC